MKKLFGRGDPMDVVESALGKRGWRYQRVNPQIIITGVAGLAGHGCLIAIRHEEDKRTVLFLFNPVKESGGTHQPLKIHPEGGYTSDQVAKACEVLMGQNYRIVLGSFERDPSDGEIRFRIALPYRDTGLTVEQVNWCIDIGIGTLGRVIPELERELGPMLV